MDDDRDDNHMIPQRLGKRTKEHDEDNTEPNLLSKSKRICENVGISSDTGGKTPSSDRFFGPVLPDNKPSVVSYGPQLPPDIVQLDVAIDEGDDVIGPLPAEQSGDHVYQLVHEIEARSQLTKNKLTFKDNVAEKPCREEWMIELPPEIQAKAIGLGPRKFKTKYNEVGDRSVWTRMPGEPASKGAEKTKNVLDNEDTERIRSQQIAQEIDEYNRTHRSESLVEMHRKKKAFTNNDQMNERRPFNRETDLVVPHKVMTTNKRSTLINDSQKSLNTKFSRGKNSFL